MKNISILLVSALLLVNCNEAKETAHDHGLDDLAQSHTVWTDKTELFVEYSPLIVKETTSFAAHFSEMQHFKAITKGKVTVMLIKNELGIRSSVDSPSSPGIFKPAIKPAEVGIYDLVFEIKTASIVDTITIKGVEVFSSEEAAEKQLKIDEENPNEINFLKEQAWKMEFANAPVVKADIYDIIKSSGEILPAQGDEKTITATTSGIVIYNSVGIVIGAEVNAGQKMFTISGGNISNENIQTQFLTAKSNYVREKANLERKKELYAINAISKSEYEDAVLSFELAESNYNNIASDYSQKGKAIQSSFKGYIKQLFKSEGEYVEAGEPLAVVTQNKRLTIKTFVGQLDFENLNNSMSANFSFNGNLFSIEDFNGRLLSYGKAISSDAPKIPVYFELDNKGDLLPGSFIEVWIKTNSVKEALTIPVTALLEDYGKYSVFVQTAGESFEKRAIKIGISDGMMVEINTGLKEGERVVTVGAYQVKMASMSGEVPAHGHSH